YLVAVPGRDRDLRGERCDLFPAPPFPEDAAEPLAKLRAELRPAARHAVRKHRPRQDSFDRRPRGDTLQRRPGPDPVGLVRQPPEALQSDPVGAPLVAEERPPTPGAGLLPG